MIRRLPVYILLDCSESMVGEGLAAARRGIGSILSRLSVNPQALETVHVSIIGFSNKAKVLLPLTALPDAVMPAVRLGNGTALGAALELVAARIRDEVTRRDKVQRGDWRPIVILLADGKPTDDLEKSLKVYKSTIGDLVANFYVVGCGEDADLRSLSKISDILLKAESMEAGVLDRLFFWMSETLTEASRSQDDKGGRTMLDSLPAGVTMVDAKHLPDTSSVGDFYLRAVCGAKRRPFIMHFKWDELAETFKAHRSHPVTPDDIDTDQEGGAGELVDISIVSAPPSCPYCASDQYVICGPDCGTISCAGGVTRSPEGLAHVCPKCEVQFAVAKGAGATSLRVRRG
jgi:uncharacterized protein YegL